MGPTLPPKIKGNLALLQYEGVSFVFKFAIQLENEDGLMQHHYLEQTLLTVENNLSKIMITSPDESRLILNDRRGITMTIADLRFIVRILLDEGIEIFNGSDSDCDTALVLFGDHKMDVLRILGNPNKEYYKDDSLFLNYLELGIDIMIGIDYRVTKFILQTNNPYHPHFCFYSRCFFELDLNPSPTSTEIENAQHQSADSREEQHSNLTMSPPVNGIDSLIQEEERKQVASASI